MHLTEKHLIEKSSWPYWADAGKPTVNGEHPDNEAAFKNCVKNEKCNFDAVSGYMRNFEQVQNWFLYVNYKNIFNFFFSLYLTRRTVTMMDRSNVLII